MKRKKNNAPKQKTPTGYEIPKRPRKDVIRDFEKVAGPPRDPGRKPA
jgi:hypothetical protein